MNRSLTDEPLPWESRFGYGARVYWFVRPPYARWAGAVLLLLVGLWVEFRPQPTELHWFAAADLRAGDVLTEEVLTPRRLPVGLVETVPPGGAARIPIPEGTPITAAMVADGPPAAPADWWTISAALPEDAIVGTAVLLVLLDEGEPSTVEGIVVTAAEGTNDWLGGDEQGRIAVPPDRAAEVAAALSAGTLTVLTALPG